MKTYKGKKICEKCGGIELPNNVCCRINKFPADIRIKAEKQILLWVDSEASKREIGVKNLPRSKESYQRAWNCDVSILKMKQHPNQYYEVKRSENY